ncbi:MAG: diaminopimelate decarboxylase [SAR324 cluster bacterium]|nr:diaminopimelate decarboxylase [SAR324 cluster bacterium]
MFEVKGNSVSFSGIPATKLAEDFGTPLYIYDEKTIRKNCQALKSMVDLPNFEVFYSAKANTNIALLKIIKSEGLKIDAMSLGELALEKEAGFEASEILFLGNNLKESDIKAVTGEGIKCCLDSLDQVERFCKIAPNTNFYIRLNPGVGTGAGHHEKVVTAGKVKFGIDLSLLDEAIILAKAQGCKVTGFMVHIGSLFLDSTPYLNAIEQLLEIAKSYPDIEYIDFGGGIGVAYDRETEQPFPFADFSEKFSKILKDWMSDTGRAPTFAMEPGRFVVAESGACLAEVQSVKTNSGVHFAGTNLGFNFLLRPEFYQAYHEIIKATGLQGEKVTYNVTGNVCESGDNLGKDRELAKCKVGDLLLVRDTGAYGYAMASNYNSMCRPAEVLITATGEAKLIRKREETADLLKNQIY